MGFKQISHSAQAVEGLTRAAQEEVQSTPPHVQDTLSEDLLAQCTESKTLLAETLPSAGLNRSQSNRFFSCAQTPAPPGSKPGSLSQQEGRQQGCVCPSPARSRPTTYHTVQLRAVRIVILEVFYCLLDFVHAIQVFLQPPSGAESKTKNKSSAPRSKEDIQTKLRTKIKRKISIPFSATRRTWDSF